MVGHNGEAQLTREQRLNLEMHQSAEEHFAQNTVMQPAQAITMDEQRQQKSYYMLDEKDLKRIELTAEEERELEQIRGKAPEFNQLTPEQEKSMKKHHCFQYAKYSRQKSAHNAALSRYNDARKEYIWLVRARRQIEGEDERAISAELSDEEKVEKMNERFIKEMKPADELQEKDREAKDELHAIARHAALMAKDLNVADDVKSYCGDGYRAINGYLRERGRILNERPGLEGNEEAIDREIFKAYKSKQENAQISDEKLADVLKSLKQRSQNVDRMLNSAVLPRDTVLTRGVSYDALKELGIISADNVTEDNSTIAASINEIQGSVYRESGVCSTSAYGDNNFFNEPGAVELVILAHKGTRGVSAVADKKGLSFTAYPEENEMMLAPGQAFRIIKAEAGRKETGVYNGVECLRIYVETIPGDNEGVLA